MTCWAVYCSHNCRTMLHHIVLLSQQTWKILDAMRCDALQRGLRRAAISVPGCAQLLCSTLGQKEQVKLKEDRVASIKRRSLPVSWSKLALLKTAEFAGSIPRASERGISTIAGQ